MVLQHDTPSRHTLMGGPLLNLKGELIGMNIARVNRAENYALPISVVQESVQRILEKRAAAGKEAAGGFLNRLPLLSGAGNGPASIFLVFPPVQQPATPGGLHARNVRGVRHRLGLHGGVIVDGLPSRARCRPGERPWRGCPSLFCSIGAFPWFRGS